MAPRNQYPARGSLDGVGDGFAITPADADLTDIPRALWVGTAGNLTVIMASGATLLLKNVPAGSLLPIKVSQVKAATTAADIVGLL